MAKPKLERARTSHDELEALREKLHKALATEEKPRADNRKRFAFYDAEQTIRESHRIEAKLRTATEGHVPKSATPMQRAQKALEIITVWSELPDEDLIEAVRERTLADVERALAFWDLLEDLLGGDPIERLGSALFRAGLLRGGHNPEGGFSATAVAETIATIDE